MEFPNLLCSTYTYLYSPGGMNCDSGKGAHILNDRLYSPLSGTMRCTLMPFFSIICTRPALSATTADIMLHF